VVYLKKLSLYSTRQNGEKHDYFTPDSRFPDRDCKRVPLHCVRGYRVSAEGKDLSTLFPRATCPLTLGEEGISQNICKQNAQKNKNNAK
jgi:hypothetical protein